MTPKEEIISAEFFQSLDELGIIPRYDLRLIMDGQIHRFSTNEDRGGEKSAAYYIHSDGWPNWGIMDFRKHDGMQKFKLSRERMPEQWDTNTQPAKQKQDDREQEAEEARKRAYNEYLRADSKLANNHPYITMKRVAGITQRIRVVTSETHRYSDLCKVGDLLIPLVNATTRNFQTLQRISKGLMQNGRHMKGIYSKTHLMGSCFEFLPPDYNEAKRIIICEGFATGASIFKVARIKSIVLSAMTCNNIINVAKVWRKRTRLPIIIAADNDNTGTLHATATLTQGFADEVFIPPIKGYDWNDFINAKEKINY